MPGRRRKGARRRKPAWSWRPAWSRKTAYGVAALAAVVAGVAVAVPLLLTGSPAGSNAANVTGTSLPSGRGPSPGGSPVSGTSASGVPAGPATGRPVAPLVTGPTPIKPANPHEVKVWYAGSAGKALKQVTNDIGAVLMAHGSHQYTQMLRECQLLATAVKAARALPPIPDSSMQGLYYTSLNDFTSGTASCQAGITQRPEGAENVVTDVNQPVVSQAVSALSAGVKQLYLATGALRTQ